MATDVRNSRKTADPPQPVVVGVAEWLLPGLGYWLLGHRARGVTIGVTILLIFLMGLLIGGVRVLEVPTYGHNGEPLNVPWSRTYAPSPGLSPRSWSARSASAAALSVYASRPASGMSTSAGSSYGSYGLSASSNAGPARGSESHARTNEIAVLYTAVAGMLNLLAIIDSSYRAGKMQEAK